MTFEAFSSPQLRWMFAVAFLVLAVVCFMCWQEHREMRRRMAWRDARLAANQTPPAPPPVPVERRVADEPAQQLIADTAAQRDRAQATCIHLEEQLAMCARDLARARGALADALDQAQRDRRRADRLLDDALRTSDRCNVLEQELDRTRVALQLAIARLDDLTPADTPRPGPDPHAIDGPPSSVAAPGGSGHPNVPSEVGR